MQDILTQIERYEPYNAQERADRACLLSLLQTRDDLFTRENQIFHMTASAWVTEKTRTHVLMVYHRIYQSWSWMGGHADGARDLLGVALREVREESGVSHVIPLSEEVFSLEVLTVDGHEKRGQYVPSHLHLNVTYLLEADASDALSVCAEENTGVRWFTLDGAVQASTEPWFQSRIYTKLNEKLRRDFCCKS